MTSSQKQEQLPVGDNINLSDIQEPFKPLKTHSSNEIYKELLSVDGLNPWSETGGHSRKAMFQSHPNQSLFAEEKTGETQGLGFLDINAMAEQIQNESFESIMEKILNHSEENQNG